MSHPRIGAVILAAGKSTRMKSELPKVLHEVCGRPMLAYVIDACREVGASDAVVVVGHRKEAVIAAFAARPASEKFGIRWVEQPEQKGTGHAVLCCREALAGRYDRVLVLCGDGPLIRPETLRTIMQRHEADGAAATLATATLDDPSGYGRIVRDSSTRFVAIVEHNDCTPAQRGIREVNPSYYYFNCDELLSSLEQVTPNNAKNEYYITDVFGILLRAGKKVSAITAVPPEDVLSINSRGDLAAVNRIMQQRVQQRLLDSGVTLVDPRQTWIDAEASIGTDTTIYPFTCVRGGARVGKGCRIGPFAQIDATSVVPDGAIVGMNGGARP